MNNIKKEAQKINFCFNFPWRNLHPGTQNTLIGGLVISQQFESLVKVDHVGNLSPSLAKSWEVSADFKRIRFRLDSQKRFSNGERVTSQDVLNSWKNSLEMSKEGKNNSLKDVLYKLDGFQEGGSLSAIHGFQIVNDLEFELVFKEPFRLAIYHLRGARFAIYSSKEGSIFGSGRYTYEVNSVEDTLQLKDRNNEVDFVLKQKGNNVEDFQLGEESCDIIYSPKNLTSLKTNEKVEIGEITSEDAVHLALTLNTKKGIFKDVRMRRAFLYLINSDDEMAKLFSGNNNLTTPDSQIYNRLSQGRLSEDEAREIILEGKSWIDEFRERVKKDRLSFLINDPSVLEPAFQKAGLEIDYVKGDSSLITKATYSGSLQQDFTAGFISVISFDPDGIYHALGKNGALLNPYMENEKIFELLEKGRQITNIHELHQHYQEVSRAFLRDVPFIHLGFSKNVLVYNKNKLKIIEDSFRNALELSAFQVK